jgi:hypothetical protein
MNKIAHTWKQKVQDPRSFIELHHPNKHMSKSNNTKKVGIGHALVHLKKMMNLMHSTMCQVQPCIKLSPSWLLEPTHTNNNEQKQGCKQNNDEKYLNCVHTKTRGTWDLRPLKLQSFIALKNIWVSKKHHNSWVMAWHCSLEQNDGNKSLHVLCNGDDNN